MTPDPLEDFFARERGQVRELPGGPDHWEEIVREARRPARRAWPSYLGIAAAAAAVVAVGYAALGPGRTQGDPAASSSSHQVTATVTRTVTASPAPGRTAATVPSGGTGAGTTGGATEGTTGGSSQGTAAPTIFPAPLTFTAVSMTNAGSGHLYSLGSARCGSAACVAVVGSVDGGRTWTTRSSFPDLTVPADRHTPEAANQLAGVRFADPMVGYVYGSKVLRTGDGGRTWAPFDVGGQRVLSLETDGTRVWLVTAAQCRHGATADLRGCTDLQVWSAPTTARAAALVRPLAVPRAAEAAWLSLDRTGAYVSVSFPDDTQALPQRVSGTPEQLSRPGGCASTGGLWVWATANSPGSLVAVCRADHGQPAYALASSADHGASWSTAVPAPVLGTPGPSGVWLTAVDRSHVVALAQALPTSSTDAAGPTAAWTTADGGLTWAPPKVDHPSRAWGWAGAAGGRLVYLVDGSAASYAVSTDSGATFTDQPFRR